MLTVCGNSVISYDGRSQVLCLCFVQIIVPPLPGKAIGRQLPFRKDDGIFEEDFIEERRQGLEEFINKFVGVVWMDLWRVLQCVCTLQFLPQLGVMFNSVLGSGVQLLVEELLSRLGRQYSCTATSRIVWCS